MPRMGRTGTALWEENENSDDADNEMALKNVSDGFRRGHNVDICGVDCGVEAINWPEFKVRPTHFSVPFPSFSRKSGGCGRNP
jgi:hypothetical protein